MRAKLLCDAGEIHEGTNVDVVSKTEPVDVVPVDAASETRPQPSYRVTDADGHAENVDTRDLKIVR